MEFTKGGYDKNRKLPVFHEDVDIDKKKYAKFWNYLKHYTD